jgi:ABC-type antimicrobial peptide transport system permease subunit
MEGSLRREHLLATLGIVFGGIALLLVSIGIFGSLSGAVTSRTKEIGVRMALGGRATGILLLVMWEAFRLVSLGLLAGWSGSLLISRFIQAQLFGVRATDPLTFAYAGGILLAVALLAAGLPAYRAARVDPLIALRCE